jgi:hypothetical protein
MIRKRPVYLVTCMSSSREPNWEQREIEKTNMLKKLGSAGLGALVEIQTAFTTSSEFVTYSSKQGSGPTILGAV